VPNYNFHCLSPADFEELSRDLLQAEFKIRFESFSAGRDRGIDLRYAKDADRTLIVQCKHYAQSGYSALKRDLKNHELPKIRNLSPARYILCTSVSLTPGRKDELSALLNPFCRNPSHILGREDLNNLLGLHQEVETNHHKLWLTSQAVLQRVLHHPTFMHTKLERTSIARRLSLYVETAAFEKAKQILDAHNYCIISGIPGIGKTTLAEILIVHLLEAGFNLVVVTSSITEALQPFPAERPQVIYYDDFLGRSSLGEKLEKNEDRSLLRLLKEVRDSSSKKLILTTREYILSQAKQTYELLNDRDLEIAKCIVSLEDYNRFDRARILYNHLYFFSVPRAHIEALLANKQYKAVIDHRNFSPRIIEWMTALLPLEKSNPHRYAAEFIESLDNPDRIWEHAFNNELTSDARQILFIVGSMPDTCPLSSAEDAFLGRDGVRNGEVRLRFSKALKEIDGTFIRTFRSGEDLFTEFHNPSIADFVRQKMGRDPHLCEEIVREAFFFDQLDVVLRLTSDGRVEREATAIVDDSQLVIEVLERVLSSHSVRVVNYNSYGERRLVRRIDTIGWRLRRVGEWAAALDSQELQRFLLDRADALQTEGSMASQSATSLSYLLGAVDNAADVVGRDVSSLVDEIALAAMRELRADSDVQDWRRWGSALEATRHRFTNEQFEAFRDCAEDFCENETQAILDNAASEEEASSWAEELAGVALDWGIPFDDHLEALRGEIAERFPEMPEPDHEFSSGFRRGGDASDEAIEDLFESLRDAVVDRVQ